ncbi:MAG: GTPase/DUF3482 domain-containing protein [Pseudomonadota bacterium]
MDSQTLKIAVVGHTNVGKTSLMRTLARDGSFGDVASSPGTTRRVEAARLSAGGHELVFFDTPGLEDSSGVLAHLKAQIDTGIDWIEAIAALARQTPAQTTFAQEGKALRQVVGSDLLLYVIDVRDNVRAKHRDELEILMRCGRPILAVLNFVAQSRAGEESWRETLARTNIHAIAPFDTFVYSEAGELSLYEKARTLLDAFSPVINQRLSDIRAARLSQVRAGAVSISQLAAKLGGLEEKVDLDDTLGRDMKADALKKSAHQAEAKCKNKLLKTFGFDQALLDLEALEMEAGLWEVDPFDAQTLADFGLNTTAAAATGAAVGLGIDLLVGGLTLGAAAATGAIVGTGLDAFRRYGRDIQDRLAGRASLKLSEQTLALILARQIALLQALSARGHGAQSKIALTSAKDLAEPLLPAARKALKGQSSAALVDDLRVLISGRKAAIGGAS